LLPLNLGATCLVTHAYIHTAEDRCRQWVLDYVGAWMQRRDANNGIVPDNYARKTVSGTVLADMLFPVRLPFFGSWLIAMRRPCEWIPALLANSAVLLHSRYPYAKLDFPKG